MRLAIEGALLSRDYLAHSLADVCRDGQISPDPDRFTASRRRVGATLGPTAGAALVFDVAAVPLAKWLGWEIAAGGPVHVGAGAWTVLIQSGCRPSGLLVVGWNRDPASVAREATRCALEQGLRFVLVTNGRVLRLTDATRPATHAALEFDLDRCTSDRDALVALHALAGAVASRATAGDAPTRLERAIDASDRTGVRVCQSLREGVQRALQAMRAAITHARGVARPLPRAADRGDEALTAVYRILFLLFAEARHLVPTWHPAYRDGYTLAALRSRIEANADPRGTWAALRAIARLAHAGCEIADLRVAPFNGRLFAPTHAPLLDHLSLDDQRVSAALAALTFVPSGTQSRRRVAYEDLGVEQLGSIYEHLLDDEPAIRDNVRSRSQRKVTGSFYTPVALTDYLVRATLEPLVHGRTADDILSLRIVDPAMGSGAFLVSACRFLAAACERARLEAGENECDDEMRAALRRQVAQRCLFGVDSNPMAVQLAQLSLWLATLSAGRPLSFLDHHLVCGDSLIGAAPADVMCRPPGRAARSGRTPYPLEAFFDATAHLAAILPLRQQIEEEPDDTAVVVRGKERSLSRVRDQPGLARWRAACDLWCAAWLPGSERTRSLYPALVDEALGRPAAIARSTVASELERAQTLARALKCFHWPLEFPEVFLAPSGQDKPNGGFDAVIGNPPWEMLRADHGRSSADALLRFSRDAGVYHAQSRGHANQYQLFVERALTLLRPGGRLGLLVPAGLLTDHGAAPLRRELLQRHGLESLLVFDNRRAIFPIHRGVRFAAITTVVMRPAQSVMGRFGIDATDQLDEMEPATRRGFPITLTTAFIHRLSGDQMAIPDLPNARDARLLEALSSAHPGLGAIDGWHATFGRELNASDDRDCLEPHGSTNGLPVIEGKHLAPFAVNLDQVVQRAHEGTVRVRLGRSAAIDRPRLAYREVAASTNRLTLIAAILPARTVSVHSVFCLRTRLPLESQDVLCALVNSYVANYLVRRWVTTHVTSAIMERLPVPYLAPRHPLFLALGERSARLREGQSDQELNATAHALAAEAYGVTRDDFAYILESFPLVPRATRQAALDAFRG
jgi:hypothetical protein